MWKSRWCSRWCQCFYYWRLLDNHFLLLILNIFFRNQMNPLEKDCGLWLKCSQNQCAMCAELLVILRVQQSKMSIHFRAMHPGLYSAVPSFYLPLLSLRLSELKWRKWRSRNRNKFFLDRVQRAHHQCQPCHAKSIYIKDKTKKINNNNFRKPLSFLFLLP